LIEAIIALTILTTAALSLVALAAQGSRTIVQARDAETELRRASAFMDVVTLWTRADLDRRLGTRDQGRWKLRIDRPVPTLYEISLLDSTETRELLRTSVYRAEAPQ
jgi:hypothetical protein